MRILMVVNWYTPMTEETLKAGVFHYEQSMALKELGEDVRLYWPFDESVVGLKEGEEKGLYVYRSEFGGNKIQALLKAIKFLNKICEEYQPDILHAHCAYPAAFVALLVGKQRKIPVMLTEHCPMEQMEITNPIKKKIRKWVYKNSLANICVSKDSKERLNEVYPNIKFEVIYNAIMNPNSFEYSNVNYRVEDSINCAIVAAFYSKTIKGYQYLIPAIKQLVDQGKRITLHICGSGNYEEYYKRLASDLGIAEYCIFYGQCERQKVYEIVRQMDFCVSASIFECSGVSVQEEMLLGKPVLVTRSGGANSLTTEYTAIVVDRESTDALVAGLNEMSTRYSEFDENKIIEYAYENFEIENVSKRYIQVYKRILQE